ncbi:MAG: hypothetical protein Q8O67_17105 [Deltaproteobacteria bacterium]|nr:hypothetical protein [Deltaproteobacteria bacterium]
MRINRVTALSHWSMTTSTTRFAGIRGQRPTSGHLLTRRTGRARSQAAHAARATGAIFNAEDAKMTMPSSSIVLVSSS